MLIELLSWAVLVMLVWAGVHVWCWVMNRPMKLPDDDLGGEG